MCISATLANCSRSLTGCVNVYFCDHMFWAICVLSVAAWCGQSSFLCTPDYFSIHSELLFYTNDKTCLHVFVRRRKIKMYVNWTKEFCVTLNKLFTVKFKIQLRTVYLWISQRCCVKSELAFMRVCVCMCVCMCLHVCVHVSVCVCACGLCVCVCVWSVRARARA